MRKTSVEIMLKFDHARLACHILSLHILLVFDSISSLQACKLHISHAITTSKAAALLLF